MKIVFLPAAQAELQPLIDKKVKRCLVNRFPYAIFYGVSEDTIVVVAIAHLKRKPAYWIPRTSTQ